LIAAQGLDHGMSNQSKLSIARPDNFIFIFSIRSTWVAASDWPE
jgi:hypothetical protein